MRSSHYRRMPSAGRLAACLAMLVAAPAYAQPARCRVTIVLAPEGVRQEIEAWVAAEPRCERELEVRVVPTDTGLYLSARDPDGRVRERVVPDAQSAAVLVVSWMADDSLGPTLPVGAPAPSPPEVMIPPSVADEAAPAVLGARYEPPEHRTLSVGLIGGERNHGLRGQIDLLDHGRWVFGAGGGWARDGSRDEDTAAAQARLFVGIRYSAGRLAMRAQMGVGVDFVHDRMEDVASGQMPHPDHVARAFELGLLGSMRLTDAWGLVGGPVLHAREDQPEPGLSLLLGVMRRL
jgi:hypothetical protein